MPLNDIELQNNDMAGISILFHIVNHPNIHIPTDKYLNSCKTFFKIIIKNCIFFILLFVCNSLPLFLCVLKIL
jgi:hypothetical protein